MWANPFLYTGLVVRFACKRSKKSLKIVIVEDDEDNLTLVKSPVAKVSDGFGKTFGPLIKLGVNGTIGTGEVKPL